MSERLEALRELYSYCHDRHGEQRGPLDRIAVSYEWLKIASDIKAMIEAEEVKIMDKGFAEHRKLRV